MDTTTLGPAKGAKALVIGGCGGIGRAYVDGLLLAGCEVAVIDRPSAHQAAPLPPGVTVIACDVTDEAAFTRAIAQQAAKFGAFDVLAHVAGINPSQTRIAELDLEEYERVMQVNLRSAIVTAKEGLPHMAEGGAILFVSSGLGAQPEPTFGSYAMSKAALNSLVKTLAKEAAPKVRVNAVAPGLAATAFLTGGTGAGGQAGSLGYIDDLGELGARLIAAIPMGRLADPVDIAGPMLFLSGPNSAYMTGQTLFVGGGKVML
ncbi:SDR family oxidoreductase [Alphaproteobacteria bacterium KMM 3653]|uniref:SDR family oxidoreductase n=1 Tax=Harenicola maris TaxID=2841044 RepID=A0AAP2CMV5_9RHOB|nr:SDR family oxidoreductase [Harenicola maris]